MVYELINSTHISRLLRPQRVHYLPWVNRLELMLAPRILVASKPRSISLPAKSAILAAKRQHLWTR